MSISGFSAAATLMLNGTLGEAVAGSASIRNQLDALTRQAADGKISDTFSGLGGGMAVSMSANAMLGHTNVWTANIQLATSRMGVTQTALTQISSIASSFFAQTNNLNGLNPSQIDSVAAGARNALAQVAGLLDTTDGGSYVFGGQDSATPPIANPDQINASGFATQIAAAVGGLATSGAAATNASTLAIASSNTPGTSPFSPALSQSATTVNALRPLVETGQGQNSVYGIAASANSFVASTGNSTTGSYTRDIMRALATLGSLSSSQSTTTGFADVVADVRTSLGGAVTALNQDAGSLGDSQATFATRVSTLAKIGTSLKSQVSGAQDVDMAATITALNRTQVQLQASYQLIASLQGMSLTKYISASG